jgi:hypothetical protein
MKRRVPPENTPRVIATAVVFFGAGALLAVAAGVFDRFDTDELAVVALFAAAFAVLTYVEDRGVRAAVNGAIAGLRGRFSRRGRTRGLRANIRT